MMFAALFGLSMDCEVFLVSQIAQHHAAGEPPRQAVRSGVASSAKVIAAAAIIMLSMSGSFILNGDPTIKQFGVGLVASTLAVQAAPARRHRVGDGTAAPEPALQPQHPATAASAATAPLED